MYPLVFIALGGSLGAISRSWLATLIITNTQTIIPIGTLTVNLLGSLGLAFLFTICTKVLSLREDVQLGLSTGFFGSFTTFSTISLEAVYLLTDYGLLWWLAYEFINISLGLVVAYLGYLMAQKLNGYYQDRQTPAAFREEE